MTAEYFIKVYVDCPACAGKGVLAVPTDPLVPNFLTASQDRTVLCQCKGTGKRQKFITIKEFADALSAEGRYAP